VNGKNRLAVAGARIVYVPAGGEGFGVGPPARSRPRLSRGGRLDVRPTSARVANPAICFGYKEPLASQFSQRSEVICLPGTPRRAGTPSRATALSDWLFCLGLPRPCAGEVAVTNHKSVLQTGTTRSREVSARIGVTSDEAENPPRLRVTYGEDSEESGPPMKRRAKAHTASAQDSST
jgi:hypothetical protein